MYVVRVQPKYNCHYSVKFLQDYNFHVLQSNISARLNITSTVLMQRINN